MRLPWCSAVLVLGLPGVAGAVQLSVGVQTAADYDSNLTNASRNVKGGFDASAGLDLALNSERDDFTWRLSYGPRYQKSLTSQRIDDRWSHRVKGGAQYRWSDATSIRTDLFYVKSDETLSQIDPGFVIDPTLPVAPGDQSIERFRLGGSASHQFSPRWSGSLTAQQNGVRFHQDSLADSNTSSFGSSLSYATSQRQRVGGGITVTDQTTDSRMLTITRTVVGGADQTPFVVPSVPGLTCDLRGVGPIPPGGSEQRQLPCVADGQSTQFFQVFGSWSFRPAPRWSLSASLGPTYINPSVGQSSTTIFANIAVSHLLKRGSWGVRFSRSQSGSFGTTVSTVASTLGTTFAWDVSEYWRVVLFGTYSLRESVLQADKRTVDSYLLRARATRQLSRRLSGFVVVSYRDQTAKGGLTTSTGFNSFEAGIGLRYSFDPVDLGSWGL